MSWVQIKNTELVASPGLLVDPDRIEHNIQSMISMVGGADHISRLRPHVKTYKMAEVVRLQMAAGINQFKAATISELEMVARCGAADVLLAYQPVGPNLARLADLVDAFPHVRCSAITDELDAAARIADRLGDVENPFRLFIDVDCGMHRTGIELGPELDKLRDWIESHSGVRFEGLHVYDGHLHDPSHELRDQQAGAVIESIQRYCARESVPSVIGGGSPTFQFWAQQTNWQCSPGTSLLWDVGYGQAYPELEFQIAAALLARVISKPASDLLCLDLGHKAVAAEMPLQQRVLLPEIPDAELVGQSEEHLVIQVAESDRYSIGDVLLALPRHICPTVALHAYATVVRDGQATEETWIVAARDR